MGRAKKVRKFAAVKRVIGQRDARLKKNQMADEAAASKASTTEEVTRVIPQVSSSLFFQV
jgi:U3 small nucleolar RNA-associated protein 24